jgi:hypothetical protein
MEEIKANLDRFEEGYAVIYCDDGRKFDVPTRSIPTNVKQGSRVIVRFEEGKIIDILYDKEETKKMEKKIKDRLERLKHHSDLK